MWRYSQGRRQHHGTGVFPRQFWSFSFQCALSWSKAFNHPSPSRDPILAFFLKYVSWKQPVNCILMELYRICGLEAVILFSLKWTKLESTCCHLSGDFIFMQLQNFIIRALETLFLIFLKCLWYYLVISFKAGSLLIRLLKNWNTLNNREYSGYSCIF